MNAMTAAMMKAGVLDKRLRHEIQTCMLEAKGAGPLAGRLLFERLRRNEDLRALAMQALVDAECPPVRERLRP